MNNLKTVDWWRDQILVATSEFLKNPNDISSAKLKSLIKAYQQNHETTSLTAIADEHERVMDYR